jgi:GNAT superfamily N-acetyltransferase
MDEANARGDGFSLRPARPGDANALTDIFLAAIESSVPGLPLAHTRDEIIVWFETKQILQAKVTVADISGKPAAFVASAEGWVHQLFVAPEHHRRGLGTALLAPILAAAEKPVRLWAFQRNAQARAFYERRGFTADLFTDGAANEERTPDVRYVWRPSNSLTRN